MNSKGSYFISVYKLLVFNILEIMLFFFKIKSITPQQAGCKKHFQHPGQTQRRSLFTESGPELPKPIKRASGCSKLEGAESGKDTSTLGSLKKIPSNSSLN